MGKYDNYSNIKNIKAIQKKLDRLTRKRKPDLYKIELVQEELENAKLFESCQIFKSFSNFAPNERVMFSDDNRVIMFVGRLIPYDDIKSYQIVEKIVSGSNTVTKSKGAVSRAIVGHAIAGDIGAVVGAMSADSHSETRHYQYGKGFFFQIFTKDDMRYSYEVEDNGIIFNRIHPKWVELGTKIQRIIDGKN